ncbi:MAG: hypothetical protein ACYCT2_08205 [Thermoplasmataceae archaeon]
MKDRVPSGLGEFKPMEISPATVEVGSSLRKLGEEVTKKENTRYPCNLPADGELMH